MRHSLKKELNHDPVVILGYIEYTELESTEVMGQGTSCTERHKNELFKAVRNGEAGIILAMVETNTTVSVLKTSNGYRRQSVLHMAAAYGQIQVLSMLLEKFFLYINPDVLNRHKQTPLMLAAMHGKITCVVKLIQNGASILNFDSLHGRTCLHYAAYYGHSDCLQAILTAAHTSSVTNSWGFARFVNVRDERGVTPLHLAARQGWPECVLKLLDNGALVCASTGGNGFPGSAPLHFAAQGGSLDCIRELLVRGADRLQPDALGRTPYAIAMKHKHGACAALLNPSSAEPLLWPLQLRLMTDLSPDTKALLQKALKEGKEEKETTHSLPSPSFSYAEVEEKISMTSNVELCCICFENLCNIEIIPCRHHICAQCTLALCCHKKPDLETALPETPTCPFCRCNIKNLIGIKNINSSATESDSASPTKPRRSRKSRNEGSGSSIKSLSSIGSFGKMTCRNSGKIVAEFSETSNNKFLQVVGVDSHPLQAS